MIAMRKRMRTSNWILLKVSMSLMLTNLILLQFKTKINGRISAIN